jgi:uncharacterized protein YutE (UPF0331/DUF86 family)
VVRADVARRLLDVLLDNLGDLRAYRARITREQLHHDRDAQHLVLHALYLAVQSTIDLALHVGADAGLAQSVTYQDAFRRLGASGLIDPQLAARLTGWAGLRNVLAHLYPVIDHGRIYDALDELSDLEAFARTVAGMLDGSSAP